jgi:hypothetical protein
METLLCDGLSSLSLAQHDPGGDSSGEVTFVCDLQYSFPNERRPRREKIGALANQLANFWEWQQNQCDTHNSTTRKKPGLIMLVHLEQDDDAVTEILDRLQQLEDEPRSANVATKDGTLLCCQSDNHQRIIKTTTDPLKQVTNAMNGKAIYLSPDAETVLSSSSSSSTSPNNEGKVHDLSCIIVGGIIDRKNISQYRSLSRALELDIPAARWPMPTDWNPNEPLNIDCILQGMQSWIWTGNLQTSIAEALEAHVRRHPGRPKHHR